MLVHLEWKDTFKELVPSANMPSYDNFYRGSGRASESHEAAKIKPRPRGGERETERTHFSSNCRDYLLFQDENRRARNRIKGHDHRGKLVDAVRLVMGSEIFIYLSIHYGIKLFMMLTVDVATIKTTSIGDKI